MLQLLHDAITDQYASFKAPRPRSIVGCSHCTNEKDLAALVAVPREQLSAKALAFYASKAITTVGDTAEFRYFWPRLVELAIRGELAINQEILFGKAVYGQHHTWPDVEQRALLRLAEALGKWLALEDLDEVDEWVCVIGLLTERLGDVRQYLAPLLSDTPAAWANLCRFLSVNERDMRRKHKLAGFWDNAPQSAAAVYEWLTSEPRAREAARALAMESAKLYGTVPPSD